MNDALPSVCLPCQNTVGLWPRRTRSSLIMDLQLYLAAEARDTEKALRLLNERLWLVGQIARGNLIFLRFLPRCTMTSASPPP